MAATVSIDVRSLINDQLDVVKVNGRYRLARKVVIIDTDDAPDQVMGTFAIPGREGILWVGLLDGTFNGQAEYRIEEVR